MAFLATILCASSCNTTPGSAEKGEVKEEPVFPVGDFLRAQLHIVDSLKMPVTRYRQGPDGSDTTAITLEETKVLAAPFFEHDISQIRYKGKYRESSFADQSIPSITFVYEAQEVDLPLRRVDVVLKPDPASSDKVRTIYMEKSYLVGNTAVEEKLYWKADHFYQVIKSSTSPQGKSTLSQLKVVWDPTE